MMVLLYVWSRDSGIEGENINHAARLKIKTLGENVKRAARVTIKTLETEFTESRERGRHGGRVGAREGLDRVSDGILP